MSFFHLDGENIAVITQEQTYKYSDLGTIEFNNNQKVSTMKVEASLNNYDIVKELGEEKIPQ